MSERTSPSPAPRPYLHSLAPFALADRSVDGHLRAIHLAQNESAVPPGVGALEAMRAAVADINRYPEPDAATLRHAIGEAEGLPTDRIICGAGSMELLALLAQAYLGPGDEIVISEYGYVYFRTIAQLVGARFVLAPERNFGTDVDAMLACVGPRTRMVLIANPNNPTGSLLAPAEVRRLRASLRSDIILVIDAAYAEYVTGVEYDPGIELVQAGANTVMTRTFSKIHGLAGLRVGWGYFPGPIADIVNRLRHPNNVSTVGIAGATAAIADRAHIAAVRTANATLCTSFVAQLRQAGFAPRDSHANFVLLPLASTEEAASAREFLKALGILVRPMSAYGLDRCLRITIGAPEDMQAVGDALRAWRAGGRPS